MSGHPEQKSPELCVKKCPAGMHPSLPHPIQVGSTLTEKWKASVVTRGLVTEVHSKKFLCKLPGCVHKNGDEKGFTRKNDIFRHINEREFAGAPKFECGYISCNHRAKQAAHIAQHVNSKHAPDELKVWHRCTKKGCEARFLDPSSLSVHKKRGTCPSGPTTPPQGASATHAARVAPAEETGLGVEEDADMDEHEDEPQREDEDDNAYFTRWLLIRGLRSVKGNVNEPEMPNREDYGPQGQIIPDSTSHDPQNPGHGPQTPPALTFSSGDSMPNCIETEHLICADPHVEQTTDVPAYDNAFQGATDRNDPYFMEFIPIDGISAIDWEGEAKEAGVFWLS